MPGPPPGSGSVRSSTSSARRSGTRFPPAERGARWAAGITDEREARDEVLRIWADNGIVEDDYYVFFHTDTVAESPEDRAALTVLIEILGLRRLPLPEGAADGEVWVRTDPRIDAELKNWA